MEALIAYLVSAMLAWAPPWCSEGERPSTHACRVGRTYPDAVEDRDATIARYEQIAADVALVVLEERPIVGGRDARARTALLLLSFGFFESAFRRDVDLNLGKFARGDFGHSWGIWQLRLDARGIKTTKEGWTGPDLIADRTKGARAALHKMQGAVGLCRGSLADRLTLYRWGTCREADDNAKARVALAERWVASHPPPPLD